VNVGRLCQRRRDFMKKQHQETRRQQTVAAGLVACDCQHREKVNKKSITRRSPDVLSRCAISRCSPRFTRSLEKRQLEPETISPSPIGLVTRFPYFVNGHALITFTAVAVPARVRIRLARPISTCSVRRRRRRGSPSRNHLDHGQRRHNMTYFIMATFVYGLTKKQTLTDSPRIQSKTDPRLIDQPSIDEEVNRRRATFIAPPQRRAGYLTDQLIRARDGPIQLQCHRMLEANVRIFPGRP